jgi:outer membrane receptor for ferrienterochelin and colicins
MRKRYTLLFTSILFLHNFKSFSQDSSATIKSLDEVVVTGEIKPQSLKTSVYSVRVINSKKIELSGATNIQQVLSTQLGFRFSNDNALGISDLQINGMSGRNVKILIDGAPVLDRFDQRASLSQIDINTIERIEIIEGPMSVSFGSDAMAGTINIITKKTHLSKINIAAKIQEETLGKEYNPLNYKGFHTQNINAAFNKNNWHLSTGLTHNEFAGVGGDEYGRDKAWLPKEQLLANAKVNFTKNKLDIYYRLDAMTEKIIDRNKINLDVDAFARSIDQNFITNRYMHQLQSTIKFNNKVQLNTIAAYTDYKRNTVTKNVDFVTNTDSLSKLSGAQDVSTLNSFSLKNVASYSMSTNLSMQVGIDINTEKASGDRIINNPSITDYALFATAEYKPTAKINIRPGFRVINNSAFKAPPIIPAINTKFILSKNVDVRLAYGYGYRAPVLRELYFEFIDVNHNIVGNEKLNAETSNSFTGAVNWAAINKNKLKLQTTVGFFYNNFNNQIELVQSKTVAAQFTYYNIAQVKTTGFNIENKVTVGKIDASLGFAYIAKAQTYEASTYKNDSKNYLWTPEVNANIVYTESKIKTSFALLYKFVGVKPAFSYEPNETPVGLYLTKTAAYSLADFNATTTISKMIKVNAGIKNIFDITDVRNNTIGNSNIAHNSEGPLSIGYGRSFILGISFNWSKK